MKRFVEHERLLYSVSYKLKNNELSSKKFNINNIVIIIILLANILIMTLYLVIYSNLHIQGV